MMKTFTEIQSNSGIFILENFSNIVCQKNFSTFQPANKGDMLNSFILKSIWNFEKQKIVVQIF